MYHLKNGKAPINARTIYVYLVLFWIHYADIIYILEQIKKEGNSTPTLLS